MLKKTETNITTKKYILIFDETPVNETTQIHYGFNINIGI